MINESKVKELFESLISGLVAEETGICDGFLPDALAIPLQQNLIRLTDADRLKSAGMGTGNSKTENQKMRGDKIFWIDNDSSDPAEAAFLIYVRDFIDYLNSSCYTGINAFEFHYALYETGTFYRRHLDQFKTNTERRFSLISYLNSDWLPAYGGELCIYHPDHTQKISPEMGKAVLFRSDRSEHEVLVANRPRMSITGWLKSV